MYFKKKSTSLDNIDDQLSAFWQQHAARDLRWGQGSWTTFSTFPYPRKIPQRNFDLLAFVRWLGDQIWEFPEHRQFPGDPIQDSPPSSSIQNDPQTSQCFQKIWLLIVKSNKTVQSQKVTKFLSVEHFSPNLSIEKPTNQVKACRQSNQIWSFVLRTCQLWSALVLFSPQSKEVRLVALSSIEGQQYESVSMDIFIDDRDLDE